MYDNPSPTWTRRAEAFGAMLKRTRLALGMTQGDLARQARINSSHHLSEIEAGKRKPSRAQLDRLCAALDLDRDEMHAALGLIPRDIEEAWMLSKEVRDQLRDVVDAKFLPLV